MKTNIFFLSFISGIMILGFGSCKKSASTSPTDNNNATVNPNTATIADNYDFNDTTFTNHGWVKTFEDNFDGDLSKWSVLHGGFTGELQCYQPANVAIVNGVLQITAKRETVTGPVTADDNSTKSFDFTSGWLLSKSTISPTVATPVVRIVTRVKVTSGVGLTSELCTFGSDWPTNGEIIAFETKGTSPNRYATDYSYGTKKDVNLVTNAFQYNPTSGYLSTAYHVYTLDWSRNALTYYIDGNLVEVKTIGDHVPDLFQKMHNMSLTVPVGRKYFDSLNVADIQGGTMYVDYVKVFTSKQL